MKLTDLNFRSKFPPLTRARVDALSAELGYPLPKDYRSFLMKYNGGYVSRAYFIAFPSQDYPSYVVGFSCIDEYGGVPSECANVNSVSFARHRYEVTYGLVRIGSIVIAMDVTDNLIVLQLTGKQAGKVGFVFAGEERAIACWFWLLVQ